MKKSKYEFDHWNVVGDTVRIWEKTPVVCSPFLEMGPPTVTAKEYTIIAEEGDFFLLSPKGKD